MKSKLPVGAIGVAICILFGYHNVHRHHEEQVRLIQKQEVQERATQQVRAEVGPLMQQLDQYRKRLSQTPDPSWLSHEVVKISQKAGVQLTTINQDLPQKLQQFTRLSVSVQLSASYHQLGTFLDLLEHTDRFIKVERLSMNGPTKDGRTAVQLGLTTLYLPPIPGAS